MSVAVRFVRSVSGETEKKIKMKIWKIFLLAAFVGETVGQNRFNLIEQMANNLDRAAVRKAMAKLLRGYSAPGDSGPAKGRKIVKNFRKHFRN